MQSFLTRDPSIRGTIRKTEPITAASKLDTEPIESPQTDPSGGVARVKGTDLVNLLNYINFQDGTIHASFRHPNKGEVVSFQALPQPSQGEDLVCRWMPPGLPVAIFTFYRFEFLLVSDGFSRIRVEAEVRNVDCEKVVFKIPEFSSEASARTVQRYSATGTSVRIYQNGLGFQGILADFNAVSFRVEVLLPSEEDLYGLNRDGSVVLFLERGEALLYSGECRITRFEGTADRRTVVFAPVLNNIRRFAPRVMRSARHVLKPSPTVRILHPLTGKHLSLSILDLSGIGFSVEESFEAALLVPGLMLREVIVEVGNQRLLKSSAQVLYRNVSAQPHGKHLVRCGVVFLDLNLQDQGRLAALLHQAMNGHFRVCSATDMEELWRFFFDSGFLYPSKYAAIEKSKESFKKVYEKLYLESPGISRHFLFQDKGTVYAHMSMIRAYPRTWLIHHHAASRGGHGLAGVAVLEQVGQYINDFHFHRSTKMDFVMCYYRRENRFPHRVFGGAHQDVADSKGISLDEFAYLHLPEEVGEPLDHYQILPASPQDLAELKRCYEAVSGGLMLQAMNLTSPSSSNDELTAQYALLGLVHSHQVFSWKQHGRLKAVVTLRLSDLGLNLSNLTNCLHVIVVDPDGLSVSTLFAGLRNLGQHYGGEDLPVLLFPTKYLQDLGIAYEKSYFLWILSMTHSDGCFQSFRNRFKRAPHGDR